MHCNWPQFNDRHWGEENEAIKGNEEKLFVSMTIWGSQLVVINLRISSLISTGHNFGKIFPPSSSARPSNKTLFSSSPIKWPKREKSDRFAIIEGYKNFARAEGSLWALFMGLTCCLWCIWSFCTSFVSCFMRIESIFVNYSWAERERR